MDDSQQLAAGSLREDVLKLRLRATDSTLGAAPSKPAEAVPERTSRTMVGGLLGFGGPALLMASVFGVSLLVGTHFLGSARTGRPETGQTADTGQGARKMAEELAMHKTDDPSARAAPSPIARDAAKTPIAAAISEPPVRSDPLPPKSSEKPSGSSERIDPIGRKIAALTVAAPVVERPASATPASTKRPHLRRADAFDPARNPNAPGAPRPLGTTAPSKPLND
jgi:hypothetical protein